MATILDSFRRGAQQSQRYFDQQTNRRIASEQAAREQSNFETVERARDYTNVFVRLRDQGLLTVDTDSNNPRLRLSSAFNKRLSEGDPVAQQAAIDIANRGSKGKVPDGFTIDRIVSVKDAEGGTKFVVGGVNADGSRGSLTEDGSSEDSALAKQFDGDELFKFTKFAFQDRDGVLYGQRAVDLNSLANSYDLILANSQREALDRLDGNPAIQRQAAATIASTQSPQEEVELTNSIRQDVGLPPVEIPDEPIPEPEADPAPKDNSTRIAQLEDELATIENRKTGSRRANVRAAQKKRAEINRLKEEQEPEEQGFLSRILTTPVQEPGAAVLPTIVEERVAPVVANKTVAEIDEAIEKGEVPTDPETVAAAAQDLQEQGVETVQDIAKLDPRRQAFAYAMIVASTPNDGNRVAVRNQLINVLETGAADRGASSVAQQKADTASGRLSLDIANRADALAKEGTEAAVQANRDLVDAIFKDPEGNATFAQLTMQKANEVANTLFPTAFTQYEGFLRRGNTRAADALRPQLNAAISFVVQSVANDGDRGVLDSFLEFFNPDVQGQFNGDLSNIFVEGDDLVYTQAGREAGNRISIGALRSINDNLAEIVVRAARVNTAKRSSSDD
tara:strand:+ start:6806 stop:8668 length:1863 start_codon:yes stop_codon:yes gene_type:complete